MPGSSSLPVTSPVICPAGARSPPSLLGRKHPQLVLEGGQQPSHCRVVDRALGSCRAWQLLQRVPGAPGVPGSSCR